MPPEGQEAKFLQIYFVGDEIEQARLRGINQPRVKQDNVLQLQKMLHEHNIYVKTFKSALERMSTSTDITISSRFMQARLHRESTNAGTMRQFLTMSASS